MPPSGSIRFRLGKLNPAKELSQFVYLISGVEGGIHGKPETLYAEMGGQKISLAGIWNYHIGLTLDELPSAPMSPEGSSYLSVLYNGMVHPFTIFPVKGVIWYQGEANVGRALSVFPSFSVADSRLAETMETGVAFLFCAVGKLLA